MPQNFISRLTGNNLNVSIIGMTGSGKSAIAIKYLTRRYITEYSPSVSEKLSKTEQVDGQDYNLTISEYPDSDNLDVLGLLQWSNVVLIIFSITSRRSFYRAQELIESIYQATNLVSNGTLTRGSGHSENSLPPNTHIQTTGNLKKSQATNIVTTQILLVSHKSDLERLRLVKREEINNLAQEFGLQLFESTCTEEFSIIEDIFLNAIRIWNNKSSMPMQQKNYKFNKVFGRTSPTPKRSEQASAHSIAKKISTSSLLPDFMSGNLHSFSNSENNNTGNYSFIDSVPSQITNVFSSLKLKPSLLLNNNTSNKTEEHCDSIGGESNELGTPSESNGSNLPPSHPKKQTSRFKFLKK